MNKQILFGTMLLSISAIANGFADNIDDFLQASQSILVDAGNCKPALYKQALQFEQSNTCSTASADDNGQAIDKAAECQARINYVLNACLPETLSQAPDIPAIHFSTPMSSTAPASDAKPTTATPQPIMTGDSNTVLAPNTTTAIKPFSFSNHVT